MSHPDTIERYAVVDLVNKHYMVYSEYELRNGLVARSWLEYTFVSPFIVFDNFMLDDEEFDEFRALVSNGGCGYIKDPLSCVGGKKVNMYGLAGKFGQAFRVSADWTSWAESFGLDSLQQARIFGTGYDLGRYPATKLALLAPLTEAQGTSSARIHSLKVSLLKMKRKNL